MFDGRGEHSMGAVNMANGRGEGSYAKPRSHPSCADRRRGTERGSAAERPAERSPPPVRHADFRAAPVLGDDDLPDADLPDGASTPLVGTLLPIPPYLSDMEHVDAGAPSTVRERLEDAFWARHSNPWSGWSRVAVSPALAYAIYRRNWRLLAAAVAFTVVNPVLFPRPERTDNWMSRGVLAEREWIESGNGTVGTDYPNVLNLLSAPAWLYALYAAFRRRPLGTAVATAASMALKLWWVGAISRRTSVAERERG